jgi:hypothetical protein
MSRSLLTQRLRALEDAGVVARRRGAHGTWEYALTPAGEELRPVVEQLGAWGQRWARRRVAPEDLDAGLLMWDVRRRLRMDQLPARKVVVRFEFRSVPRGQASRRVWWLVADRGEADVCVTDPGFEEDLRVDADLGTFTQVWTGRLDFSQAVRTGQIRLDGPREIVRAFPGWLALSAFASVTVPA